MLFLAITKTSLLHRFRGARVEEFHLPGSWHLTVVLDGFLADLHTSPEKIIACESLLRSATQPGVEFITAEFNRQRQILAIRKTCISGRAAYYHCNSAGEFFFSTHIRLLHRAGVELQEASGVQPELFMYRLVAPPRTLFRNIFQLAAAGSIRVQMGASECRLEVSQGYYPPARDKQMPVESDLAAMSEAVVQRLTATLNPLQDCASEVAMLLSGGLDSSVLCKVARGSLQVRSSYSAGYAFEDPQKNHEKEYALSAASALGMKHQYFEPSVADYLFGFIEAVWENEGPLHHLQSVLLYLLFEHAMPPQQSIVLSGAAADSAFGLELHHLFVLSARLPYRLLSTVPAIAALKMTGPFWGGAADKTAVLEKLMRSRLPIADTRHPIWTYGAYGDLNWIRERFDASPEDIIQARYAALRLCESMSLEDILAIYSMNYCETGVTMAIWSKLAESHGRIFYCPFAAEQVLDYAFSLPWSTKLLSPKHVLRSVARRIGVPEPIVSRPKQSFGVSRSDWAQPNGIFEPLVAVAAKAVDAKLFRAVQASGERGAMTFWILLNYAVWKRLFIQHEQKEKLLSEVGESLGQVVTRPYAVNK